MRANISGKLIFEYKKLNKIALIVLISNTIHDNIIEPILKNSSKKHDLMVGIRSQK